MSNNVEARMRKLRYKGLIGFDGRGNKGSMRQWYQQS